MNRSEGRGILRAILMSLFLILRSINTDYGSWDSPLEPGFSQKPKMTVWSHLVPQCHSGSMQLMDSLTWTRPWLTNETGCGNRECYFAGRERAGVILLDGKEHGIYIVGLIAIYNRGSSTKLPARLPSSQMEVFPQLLKSQKLEGAFSGILYCSWLALPSGGSARHLSCSAVHLCSWGFMVDKSDVEGTGQVWGLVVHMWRSEAMPLDWKTGLMTNWRPSNL